LPPGDKLPHRGQHALRVFEGDTCAPAEKGESAVHDQRSPDGDLLLLLPGHVVPDALLVVQLHDRPLSNNSVLFPPSVGPSGRAWLVDTSADVVQQDAERIHQGYQGWDGKNGGSKETKETNRGAEVR